jgi:exonuclease SbcD
MRLLHTSDWHLGHTLHQHDRGAEHDAFFAWLLDQLSEHAIDALLVTGDIFDTANPPATAQERFYGLLADARRRCPKLDIVVIGGNHDSAARLDAPDPLLRRLGIRVVGGLPRQGREIDVDAMLVPLHRADGEVGAWCAAVPFLRPAELPRVEGDDPLIAGVRAVYEQVLTAARARRAPGQALVVTGHCYVAGGEVSELSERRILGGNQHALPVDVLGDDVDYVALGHLHLAQRVGRDTVRYAGSPLPLALDERRYPHQVVRVELGEAVQIEALRVPRTVELLRVPDRDAAPLAEVLDALRALPLDPALPRERWPFLELAVRLDAPDPTLRRQVDDALAGRPVRLTRIGLTWTGSLAAGDGVTDLRGLDVEQVLQLAWSRRYREPPDDEVMAAFRELVEQAMGEQA